MGPEELQRRMQELERVGQEQVRSNSPRDLSSLDMGAAQAAQRIAAAKAASQGALDTGAAMAAELPPTAPMGPPPTMGPPTAAFPPVPPAAAPPTARFPNAPRSLAGLRPTPRGY